MAGDVIVRVGKPIRELSDYGRIQQTGYRLLDRITPPGEGTRATIQERMDRVERTVLGNHFASQLAILEARNMLDQLTLALRINQENIKLEQLKKEGFERGSPADTTTKRGKMDAIQLKTMRHLDRDQRELEGHAAVIRVAKTQWNVLKYQNIPPHEMKQQIGQIQSKLEAVGISLSTRDTPTRGGKLEPPTDLFTKAIEDYNHAVESLWRRENDGRSGAITVFIAQLFVLETGNAIEQFDIFQEKMRINQLKKKAAKKSDAADTTITQETADALAKLPALDSELKRLRGHVTALRIARSQLRDIRIPGLSQQDVQPRIEEIQRGLEAAGVVLPIGDTLSRRNIPASSERKIFGLAERYNTMVETLNGAIDTFLQISGINIHRSRRDAAQNERHAIASARRQELIGTTLYGKDVYKGRVERQAIETLDRVFTRALEGTIPFSGIQKVIIEGGNFYDGPEIRLMRYNGDNEQRTRESEFGLKIGRRIADLFNAKGVEDVQKAILVDTIHAQGGGGIDHYRQFAKDNGFEPASKNIYEEGEDASGKAIQLAHELVRAGKATKSKKGEISYDGDLLVRRENEKDVATCALLEVPIALKKVEERPQLSVVVLPESYISQQRIVQNLLTEIGQEIPTVAVYFNKRGEVSSVIGYHLNKNATLETTVS